MCSTSPSLRFLFFPRCLWLCFAQIKMVCPLGLLLLCGVLGALYLKGLSGEKWSYDQFEKFIVEIFNERAPYVSSDMIAPYSLPTFTTLALDWSTFMPSSYLLEFTIETNLCSKLIVLICCDLSIQISVRIQFPQFKK